MEPDGVCGTISASKRFLVYFKNKPSVLVQHFGSGGHTNRPTRLWSMARGGKRLGAENFKERQIAN
jgi:hypothetical protein